MGCCCSQPDERSGEPDARTPLLSGKPGTATAVTQQPGISAYDEPIKAVPPDLESSSENGSTPRLLKKKIELAPTNVQSVDKRLQDHARLFNELHDRLSELESTIKELSETFDTQLFENQAVEKTINGVMRHVAGYCGKYQGNRHKEFKEGNKYVTIEEPYTNNFQINYEGKEIHYTIIPAINLYNKANKLVNDINTRSNPLIQSVELVIKNEKELKREILVASLGSEGPESMKQCIKGVKTLKRIPPTVNEIDNKTAQISQELCSAIEHLKQALQKEVTVLDETDKTVKADETDSSKPVKTEEVQLEENDENQSTDEQEKQEPAAEGNNGVQIEGSEV